MSSKRKPNAETLADGRWAEILAAAGIDRSFLTGRAGPCPFCPDGGTDRFVFQNNKGGGRYLCRVCTEARYRSGFDFLMRHMGYREFWEAADHVREFCGHGETNGSRDGNPAVLVRAAKAPVSNAVTPELIIKRTAKMESLMGATRCVVAGDPVDLYLKNRIKGLVSIPEEIRFHPALEYWDPPEEPGGRYTLRGLYPAMLVRGLDADGRLVQVHKTFLTHEGRKADVPFPKKTDVGVGSNSFALRMGWPTGDTLGVCEGIETGVASTLLGHNVPVWPCHSASVMANFILPVELRGQIKRVIIFSDNDALKHGKRAGQDASQVLANRLRTDRVRSLIVQSARVGTDMVDLVAMS